MKRTVVRRLIDDWVIENRPDGLSKLAVLSNVSFTVLSRARRLEVPAKECTRRAIARSLGVSEDDLFPLVEPLADGSTDVAS